MVRYSEELVEHDCSYRSRVYYHPLDRLAPFNREISDKGLSIDDTRVTFSEIEFGDTQAALALWGKNITNRHYQYAGIDFGRLGFAISSYAEPRT